MLLHGKTQLTTHAVELSRGLGRVPPTAKPNINPRSAPIALCIFIHPPKGLFFVKDAPGSLTNWLRNAAPGHRSTGGSASRSFRYDLALIRGPAAVSR